MARAARSSRAARFVYFILGVLLLPACVALTVTCIQATATAADLTGNLLWFGCGFVSHLTFFLVLNKPMRTYVIGHELTHALWVVLLRGRVKRITVGKQSGSVYATKVNPLIALAPYFFPLYMLAVLGLYALVRWLAPAYASRGTMLFAVGFTWSFHLLLNTWMLTHEQDDVRVAGVIFSYIAIYLLNVVVLGLLLSFVSTSISLEGITHAAWRDLVYAYTLVARPFV
ncbi:MAG: hypothetical protein JW889_04940 [Verrucomicrobia bacterium]|nr:hypothetical protein [Verrucomicrobiota bacterium]